MEQFNDGNQDDGNPHPFRRNVSRGLGLSGPNGDDNMKKLMRQREERAVILNSQGSITDHMPGFDDDPEEEDVLMMVMKPQEKPEQIQKSSNFGNLEHNANGMDIEEEQENLKDREMNSEERLSSEKAVNFIKQSTFGAIMELEDTNSDAGNGGDYERISEDSVKGEANLFSNRLNEVSFRQPSSKSLKIMNADVADLSPVDLFDKVKHALNADNSYLTWDDLEFNQDIVQTMFESLDDIREKYD